MLVPAKRPEKIFGLDASLSSTGYAFIQSETLRTGRIVTTAYKGPQRLAFVRSRLQAVLEEAAPDLVVMEGYSMGNRGGRGNVFSIAELGGVLTTAMWDMGISYILVPPTTLKSAIAMNGRAEKADIIAALQTYYGLKVMQHDEADAAGLMVLGEIYRGIRQAPHSMAESNRLEAVFKLKPTKGKMKSVSTKLN